MNTIRRLISPSATRCSTSANRSACQNHLKRPPVALSTNSRNDMGRDCVTRAPKQNAPVSSDAHLVSVTLRGFVRTRLQCLQQPERLVRDYAMQHCQL